MSSWIEILKLSKYEGEKVVYRNNECFGISKYVHKNP